MIKTPTALFVKAVGVATLADNISILRYLEYLLERDSCT